MPAKKKVVPHEEAKKIIESGEYDTIPTSMSQNDLHYVILILQLVRTIMYYQKHYISKETGLHKLPTIWSYLCATLNETEKDYNKDYYDEIVEHRKKLGFPVEENGNPKINARTFERLVAGKRVKKGMEILEEFYRNENFLKIYWEFQEKFAEEHFNLDNILSSPKSENKMVQIIETVEREAFSNKYGKKFSSKAEFVRWRHDNLETYKDMLSHGKLN